MADANPGPKPIPLFAFGNVAVGWIAVGNVAIGFVAIGFSVAIGPIAIGMNSIGWILSLGLNAVGGVALALINGIGLFTVAGVNGLGAASSPRGVNHSVVPALGVVFATGEAIAAYLVRPPPTGETPTVPLASLLSGELPGGEVEARLLELGGGRGVLEQRGRRAPIEVPDMALAGEGKDGPTYAVLRGESPWVRVRLLVDRRVTAADATDYRVARSGTERVLVAQSVEIVRARPRFRLALTVSLVIGVVASIAATAVALTGALR